MLTFKGLIKGLIPVFLFEQISKGVFDYRIGVTRRRVKGNASDIHEGVFGGRGPFWPPDQTVESQDEEIHFW